MEATKEIKIILYILVVMVGMQMGFTFNKLNMMEDKIEAITMESDSTPTAGRYALSMDSRGDFKMLDTATGAIWDRGSWEDERRWVRHFPEVGEKGFSVYIDKQTEKEMNK